MQYKEKKLSSVFFRAYDIRGIVSDEFDEHAFYTMGRAVGYRLHQLHRQEAYVARDGRLTSHSLAQALSAGLMHSGINVVDIGEITSPILYYATHTSKIDSGIIITASHNPAEYNGVKLVLAGRTLAQKDISELYDIIALQKFVNGQGELSSENVNESYIQRIVQDIKLQRPFKLVVDCGNGVAGKIIPFVFSALGCTVIPLYCEVNGHFPNHHPDPSIEDNLQDLKRAVCASEADIGFAFDGDADRLGVVTERGETIWADRLLIFYARDLLAKIKQVTVVFDVKCSKDLPHFIEKMGGTARMCPTGHSIVKQVMEEEQAVLAGEMSGHVFFKDRWYGFDDALYSACRLLEILSQQSLKSSQQFATIPSSISTPEIKIPIAEHSKFSFVKEFIDKNSFPEAKLITIDGVRAEFATGWGLLRASNTTPNLIARFEAQTNESLTEIQQLFKAKMLQIDPLMQIPF